jgi:hypothetical protein
MAVGRYKYKWHSIFRNTQNKVSAMEVGFLMWLTVVTLCWGFLTIKDGKMADIPRTVVHVTLALGGTKVAHKLAENNWEKVAGSIVSIFKKKPIPPLN